MQMTSYSINESLDTLMYVCSPFMIQSGSKQMISKTISQKETKNKNLQKKVQNNLQKPQTLRQKKNALMAVANLESSAAWCSARSMQKTMARPDHRWMKTTPELLAKIMLYIYITLHHITLRYVTLRYITLHYIQYIYIYNIYIYITYIYIYCKCVH